MYKSSFSFVIPAFNEEGNIKKIIDAAYDYLNSNFNSFEIIIVNDGSSDNTGKICKELGLKYGKNLIAINHDANLGYGAALRTGLFSAKNELVFYTDADCQFDITEISNFMNFINDYDLVIGFRLDRKDNFIRKLCAFVYNRMVFILFGLDVKDIDCSFKLFKREALGKLSIDRNQFLVDTELLVKARLNNLAIKQLGVKHFPRFAGKSTVKPKHIFITLKDLNFLYWKLKKGK